MAVFKRKFVFLFGGLGNQLFQFTYAHYIAEFTQSRVILLDATGRLRVSRKFELEFLLAECNHGVSGSSLSIFSILLAKFLNLKSRINTIFKSQSINENHSQKFPMFNIGHYIDIRYIMSVQEFILSDIRKLVLNNSRKSQPLGKEGIRLAAHIRRGDYDANYHGHLSLDYYSQIFSRLNYDNLIVHTDDLAIANRLREEFPQSTIYGPGEATAWDVLSDFANSEIVVTANSSLSWWGAWLCVQNGGEAHLPSIWLRKGDHQKPVLLDGFIIEESIWD
jgi:hypothetical protein